MTKNLADELQRTARQALVGMHPLPQGAEPGGLPFRKLLAAAFRARYLLIATTLFGLLVGAFLAITTANSYVSTGNFRFSSSGAERSTIDAKGTTETSLETLGAAATYVLSTDELMRRVVDKVTPARILTPYQPGGANDSAMKSFFFSIQRDWNATKQEDMTPEEALKRLKKTLSIERPRGTDVLVVTCTANEPKLANEILSIYMEEAIKWHIEKYEEQREYNEAEKDSRESEQAHDQARRALREFLDRKLGVANFDDEKKRLSAEEADALARVKKITEDLAIAKSSMEARVRQVGKDGSIPQFIKTKQRVDRTSEIVSRLNQDIARKEIERADLIAKAKSDPRVGEIEQSIKTLREKIAELETEAKNTPLEEVPVENPEWVAAKVDLGKLQREVDSFTEQLKLATQIQTSTSTKLKALLELEPEFEKLHNAVLLADQKMQAAQITWLAAQRKKALGQGNFSSLRSLGEPSLPLEKEGPNRGKQLLGGLLVGLFFGLALILLRALPDTVVRTREDLERIDGLQVIGVLPRLDNRNLKRHGVLREKGW